MLFLGTTFCSGKYALTPAAAPDAEITSLSLADGTYTHLYLSADPSATVSGFDADWTWDTKLNANFESSLEAGNSGFSTRTTDYLVIRRRERGTIKWTTIFVKKIENIDDFLVHVTDTYARAGTEYEYCVSSFAGGMENSYDIRTVYSDFDGFYITDKDCLYGTIYDVDGCNTSRNMTTSTLELLNSRYLTVVSHSDLDCDSGSITGTFLKTDDGRVDNAAGLEYRNAFKRRLASKKPFILKLSDGRIWLVRVTGTPTDSQGSHADIRKLTFEWVEIGDVNDMQTLYETGLSDIEARWW